MTGPVLAGTTSGVPGTPAGLPAHTAGFLAELVDWIISWLARKKPSTVPYFPDARTAALHNALLACIHHQIATSTITHILEHLVAQLRDHGFVPQSETCDGVLAAAAALGDLSHGLTVCDGLLRTALGPGSSPIPGPERETLPDASTAETSAAVVAVLAGLRPVLDKIGAAAGDHSRMVDAVGRYPGDRDAAESLHSASDLAAAASAITAQAETVFRTTHAFITDLINAAGGVTALPADTHVLTGAAR